MESEEFKRILEKYRPNVNDLIEKRKYSVKSAERIFKEYTIKRKLSHTEKRSESKILNFINCYDVSTLNVLNIRFIEEYEKLGQNYIIGYATESLMIINNKGSIQGVNVSDIDEVIWDICHDSENFLLVLALLLEYNHKLKTLRNAKAGIIKELFLKLLPVIGGEKYILFYKFIFDI